MTRSLERMKRATGPDLTMMLLIGVACVTMGAPAEPKPGETISKITCKPSFDRQERQDIHVTDSEGRAHTAFRQWLILEDGKQSFRIPWGSPPLSRGPVELSLHQIYTFTVSTKLESKNPVLTVLRILKAKEVVYDAADRENNSNKPEQSNR